MTRFKTKDFANIRDKKQSNIKTAIANKIRPTIFDIEADKDITIEESWISNKKLLGKIKTDVVEHTKTAEYVKISNYAITSCFMNSSVVLYKVFSFICFKLEFGSNIVIFTQEEIKNTVKSDVTQITKAINKLCEENIIAKTTNQSEYLINHNHLFKGSIKDFISNYEYLWWKGKANKLANGKADIDSIVITDSDLLNIVKLDDVRKKYKEINAETIKEYYTKHKCDRYNDVFNTLHV